ncbi:MAG: S26 family signal peptidase [Pirellulaceae bacterium]|nr:S26 family signal peptidase [Pirellulaceae bacterium]
MAHAASHPEESAGRQQRFSIAHRWAFLAVCLLLVSGWACSRLVVRGLVFPIRVVEGSMAPNLCGDHYQIHCPQCGSFFRVDALLPHDFILTCPQCGHRFEYEPGTRIPGDRVILNRWDGLTANIQRWDLVAATDPLHARRLVVKRVVALPGERVSIEHGNVLINGKLVRKSLPQLRAMAILVSDEPAPQKRSIPSSWLPLKPEKGWSQQHGIWSYSRNTAVTAAYSWLVFSPRERLGRQPTAVFDDYPYNQSTSRQLQVVNDLLLTVEPETENCDELKFRLQQSDQVWEVVLDFDRREIQWVSQNETLISPRLPSQISMVELAICDGQLLLGINGKPVLMEAAVAIWGVRSPVISIGARSGNLKLKRLSVARDVFYLPPRRTLLENDFSWQLSKEEFFLLGDNCPISIDSRDPRYGPFDKSHLLGTVRRLQRAR